jgi:hypothetical protein
MKLSYAITVCNELEEVKNLINFLHLNKREEDEICVLLDKPKASHVLVDWLYRFSSSNWITLKESAFQGHFADWKNELTRMCSGDYIFQIDADEIPNLILIKHLPEILSMNENVDVMLVPRVNTVEGLTEEHIQKWGWRVDDKGWVNFPDHQWRIYKNTPEIQWKNKVHEILEGFKVIANLPGTEAYSLYHHKQIERQEKQNNYYNTL